MPNLHPDDFLGLAFVLALGIAIGAMLLTIRPTKTTALMAGIFAAIIASSVFTLLSDTVCIGSATIEAGQPQQETPIACELTWIWQP